MKKNIANHRLPYREDWEALINEYGQEGIIAEIQNLWRTHGQEGAIGVIQSLWRADQVATIIALQPLFIDKCNYDAENV